MVWNLHHLPTLSGVNIPGNFDNVFEEPLFTPWKRKYPRGSHNLPFGYQHGYMDSQNDDSETSDDDYEQPNQSHTSHSKDNRKCRIIPIQHVKSFADPITEKDRDAPKNNDTSDVISIDSDVEVCNEDGLPLTQQPWIPSLNLNMQDREDLLNGLMLSDKHIYAAQKLLQKQFPNIKGFQDTCLSQIGFSHISEPSIQIHHVDGNHWVLSSSLNGHVEVYDSIYNTISQDLNEQLFDIYGKRRTYNPPVQKQRGGTDCGLFVIAWAYELCSGRDVETLVLSQSEMRSHLLLCFEDERLSSFPEKSSYFGFF